MVKKIFDQMKTRFNLNDFTEIFFHTGKKYRENLIPRLKDWGIQCKIPLEHLGIGKQLAWYKKHDC